MGVSVVAGRQSRLPPLTGTQEGDMPKSNRTTQDPTAEVSNTEVDGTPKLSKSQQLRKYKAGYETYQGPNGNLSMDNGDDIALILRGASPEAVMGAAERLKGLEPGTLATRYADRNPGAKRMNSGNQIRGLFKRGDITTKEVIAAIKAASKVLNTPAK